MYNDEVINTDVTHIDEIKKWDKHHFTIKKSKIIQEWEEIELLITFTSICHVHSNEVKNIYVTCIDKIK